MNSEYQFKRFLVSVNNTKDMPHFLAFRNLKRAVQKVNRAGEKAIKKLFYQ